MKLGKRLKELREEKGLLQKDVAKYLKITTSAYGYYEQGKRDPDTETLQKLADFFNVSVDYLLGRTDIKNPYINNEYREKFRVTKRDLEQYENFIKHVEAFFMNDEVGEEDKEALFRDISELFWKAKEKNKKKYEKKKNKE
jgi:transcriptional regulator with XRE-family HTH domain